MLQQRGLLTVIIVIFLVTLPSILSLSWYYVTEDPNIRPLGITRENLLAFQGSGSGVEIVAFVDWDSNRSGQVSRTDMQQALINSFKVKGVEVWVIFEESTSGTRVSYHVGPSVFGPYPQSRAAEGIVHAVAAYRMNKPYGR